MNIDEQQVKVGNINVNFKIAGMGRPFLILHGWGGKSESWLKVQEILSQKGFQVIVPDLPGFGKTKSPERPWTLDDYRDFIKKFCEVLNLHNFILLGHSFGGRISIKLCSEADSGVSTLILCNSAGIPNNRGFFARLSAMVSSFFRPIWNLPGISGMREGTRFLFYRLARNADYTKYNPIMRETFLNIVKYDLTPFLGKIMIPTFLIWGENDDKTPLRDGQLMSEKIKNSRLHIIKSGDHVPNLKMPAELSHIILDFFK